MSSNQESKSPFAAAVEAELSKARNKHIDITCAHEAYAVILEEVDEVWDKIKSQKYSPAKLLKELIQVGAMAQRAAEDLGLIQTVESRREYGSYELK